MSTPLRNVDADLRAPASDWPFEAVLTVLERGGVNSWFELASEIRVDPWGAVARKVEEALAIAHPYGVEPLMRTILSAARRDREQAERLEVATRIRAAVARSGLTQAQFAERIGTSASRLSTYVAGKVVPSATMLVRIEKVAGEDPGL